MGNKIQVRRGLKADLTTLSAGEPGFTTDTNELYIGSGTGNVKVASGERRIYSDATDEFITFGTMTIRGVEYTKIRWAYEGKPNEDPHFTVSASGEWKCNRKFNDYSNVFADVPLGCNKIFLSATLCYEGGGDTCLVNGVDNIPDDGAWMNFNDSGFTAALSDLAYLSVIEFAIPTSSLK